MGGFENFEIQGAPFVIRPPNFSRGDWIFIMKMQFSGFKKVPNFKKFRLRRAIVLCFYIIISFFKKNSPAAGIYLTFSDYCGY